MEIPAIPQTPALHLQWGLDGEALGTGAALQPSSSPCLPGPPSLLAGLVKTPHSEA